MPLSLEDIFLTIFTFHYVLKTVNGRHRRVESKMECSKYFMCICMYTVLA